MNTLFSTDIALAQQMDEQDELRSFRDEFYFPEKNGKSVIYFCGNSLGLQPKKAQQAIEQELADWKNYAVEGYGKAKTPWLYYQQAFEDSLSTIMGCKKNEVTIMNTLTVNLHFMMLSFYRPTTKRYKIIMEAGAFPSDQYAVETQVNHYGLNPETTIIEVSPRAGKKILYTEDILKTIEQHGETVALVLFSGIQYYTGQLFDIVAITEAAHKVGAIAGFDLAHVAGNVTIQLHNWNVDFAVWCSYKYLNAGPGAVGGAFIHEKHASNINQHRLGGWWGNEEKTRFLMQKGFIPKPNASGWNNSTAQVFNMVCLKASLNIFDKAGMQPLRKKSISLTNYLSFLIHQLTNIGCEIITPEKEEERGAQLSLFFKENGKQIQEKLLEAGIVVDYREPGVIRVAPAPLYNSFKDIYAFYNILSHF